MMCGIAGILEPGGRRSPDLIEAMTGVLSHRGPDGEGFFVDNEISLGHRRLAIIDLSENGKQPMSNEDGTVWLTFNGEIYNFLELQEELKKRGHRFRSATDTEIIIHAYEEWGLESVHRLNGMFAFGLWDSRLQRLWIARDRLGVKPLFYAQLPDRFLFASEIKSILQDDSVDRSIDFEALSYYLALNYTPAPYTLFARVRQLLPGHYATVGADGEVTDVEYWDLVFREGEKRRDRDWIEEFASLFSDSVRLRLVSDVPFGVFLSGGLDSSSVAYCMARELSVRLKTFSIGFNEPSFDELVYADTVARAIGAEHHEHIVHADAAAILPRLVWHAEEPTADSSMVAVYYLAKETRRHVSMVQSGDGADELLAGYETYQAYYAHRLYGLLPAWLRSGVLKPLVERLPSSDSKVSFDSKLKRFVKGAEMAPEDAHCTWRMIFDRDERAALLGPASRCPGAGADVADLYRGMFGKTNALHPLDRMLYVDTRFYLPNDMLVKVDRMTMAHGLEAREPFLDYRLVEFLATVPPRLKLRYFQKKYLLKAAMKEKLPDSIVKRKKQGFNVPNARWIKKGLREFTMDNLSAARIKAMGFLDGRLIQKILDQHFSGQADNSHGIWCLLTLAIWWETFVGSTSCTNSEKI